MKKKIIIGVVVLLLGGGYEAKAKLFPPKVVKMKVNGEVYLLPKQFMINLQGSQYATLTVALVLAPGQTDGATAAAATASDAVVGTLPEEAVIRAIITNALTDDPPASLLDAAGRAQTEKTILKAITSQTDDKIKSVLFTDLAVQ